MTKRPLKSTTLAKDLDELTALLKRTQADFENYRRRSEEDKVALLDFAKAQVLKDLLPLIDNLERALNHLPKELAKNDWAKGVTGVAKQVQETLAKMDVERIETVGKAFDPHLHEAVSVDGDSGEEIISEELQAGYRIGDEVLRHAVVKVKRESAK